MAPPDAVARKHKTPGRFLPAFWSPLWFPGQAGPMGLLCDTNHPALAAFPTDMHTNWQWFHLLDRSCCIILDDDAKTLRLQSPERWVFATEHIGEMVEGIQQLAAKGHTYSNDGSPCVGSTVIQFGQRGGWFGLWW